MKNALTIAYVGAGFLAGLLLRALWMQDLPYVVKVTATVGGLIVYLAPFKKLISKGAAR